MTATIIPFKKKPPPTPKKAPPMSDFDFILEALGLRKASGPIILDEFGRPLAPSADAPMEDE